MSRNLLTTLHSDFVSYFELNSNSELIETMTCETVRKSLKKANTIQPPPSGLCFSHLKICIAYLVECRQSICLRYALICYEFEHCVDK